MPIGCMHLHLACALVDDIVLNPAVAYGTPCHAVPCMLFAGKVQECGGQAGHVLLHCQVLPLSYLWLVGLAGLSCLLLLPFVTR